MESDGGYQMSAYTFTVNTHPEGEKNYTSFLFEEIIHIVNPATLNKFLVYTKKPKVGRKIQN